MRFNDLFSSVVKYFKPIPEHRDDFGVSAIHYKLISGLLIACSLMTGLTAWYSQIECQVDPRAGYDTSLIKHWCYAQSTFVIETTNSSKPFGLVNTHAHSTNEVVHLMYYRWVTLAFFVQAVCFQIPRIVWKSIENGRVRRMADFVKGLEFVPAIDRVKKIEPVVDYFLQTTRRHEDRKYFSYCVVCQMFYLIITIAQIHFAEAFLNGQFVSLVPLWLLGKPVLDSVFPTQAKCLYRTYGAGGSLQRLDFLCVLAMNVLISKIYVLMWFLLALALVASTYQTFYLTALYFSTKRQRNLFGDMRFVERLSLTPADCLLLRFFRGSVDSVTFEEFKEVTLRKFREATAVEVGL
ncbi:innexin inx2-like [Galendromus occidentalis]|uniref:Innexin n=1 Tax=Galendromus occidentalis TaxID=34638 RepID=A0AAJ6QUR3_9ACAR|nr:innexin inx2-like [Galendromus occidentalis]